MAKRYKEPDKLALDMMKCKADGYGCHYGHWKAAQEQVQIEKKEEIPEGWMICTHCGKPFKPKVKRVQKYCEPNCANKASRIRRREKHKEYQREWRARQKEGADNG